MMRKLLTHFITSWIVTRITFTVSGVDVEDFLPDNNLEDTDKSNKLLRRGYKNWEERCLINGGEKVLQEFLSEQENLIYCMLEQFNPEIIQHEIESNKLTGDLDLVFKRYCSENVPIARDCLARFLSVSSQCLLEDDRPGLNVTLAMVDSAINFTCHSDGDRIALFMSEEGVECVSANKNHLVTCVKEAVPELFGPVPLKHRKSSHDRLHFYVFQQENCRKGDAIIDCVEKSLLKCNDPTPSNLLHGLLSSMRAVTPCSVNCSTAVYLARSLFVVFIFILWNTQDTL